MKSANLKAFPGRTTRILISSIAAIGLLTISAELRSQSSTSSAMQQVQQMQQSSGVGQGAASATVHGVGPTVAPEDVSKMKLMPGSSVDVRVFEEPDLDGTYRLDSDGNISLPLAGPIQLQSRTLREAESAIGSQLIADQILKTAHVIVDLDEYSAENITVLGEVSFPGRFPVLGPRSLMDMLVQAGGETQLAGNEIVIHRLGQPSATVESIHYGRDDNNSAALSTMIDPGDSVLVKRAGIVYVLGAVNRPGGYVMQESGELNVDEAIALAAGTSIEAKLSGIRIFRKQADGSLIEIAVSYSKINSGSETPLRLNAQDIVYVPPSALKTALFRGTQVLSAAASATIYTTR